MGPMGDEAVMGIMPLRPGVDDVPEGAPSDAPGASETLDAIDAVGEYLGAIGRHALLTREQEVTLSRAVEVWVRLRDLRREWQVKRGRR